MKKYLLSSTYFWALFNEYHRRNVRLLLRHGSRVLQSSMMLHSLGCSQLWMFWEKQMVPLSMVKQSIMVFGLPEHWRKRLPPLYLDWLNMEGRDYRPCIWTAWTLKEETTAPVFHQHQPYPDGEDLRAPLFEWKSVIPDHKFYLRAASDDTRRH